jgi:hypothetical protein
MVQVEGSSNEPPLPGPNNHYYQQVYKLNQHLYNYIYQSITANTNY